MVNFYAEPSGPFTKEIHICQLNDVFERWAVMGKPCDLEAGQKYGYKGYVADSSFEGILKTCVYKTGLICENSARPGQADS